MTDSAATDRSVLAHIDELVTEEKALRSSHAGNAMTEADRARLKELAGQLDQAWDLLRQRRAHEQYEQDPGDSTERTVENVTKYLQ